MAKVLFKRYETDLEAQSSDVIDGQFIVTKEGTSYIDYGEDRTAFGGLSYNEVWSFVYPIGSYYETSDGSFDPNVTWGGTWVLDSKGKVTVARDENDTDFDTLGETGGSKELQAHTHTTTLVVRDNSGTGQTTFQSGNSGTAVQRSYTSSSAGTGNSGNLQPYIVVNRWHRTA